MSLDLLSKTQRDAIVKRFVKDLESFSVVDSRTNTLHPVICAVCDSIPDSAQWHCFVDMNNAIHMFRNCLLRKRDILNEYPASLIMQYTANHPALDDFVLSPMTYVNENDEVLVCNSCYKDLQRKSARSRTKAAMPEDAISNNRLVGDAPPVIERLSQAELSIIGMARIYCQSWVFFAGCHQHIKGWHTFYKNRTSETVGNLMQLKDAGMRGSVLVVLCGPFTSSQKAMTLEATNVNPPDVVNALRWLTHNNFKYSKMTIPHVDDIPVPHVIYEDL